MQIQSQSQPNADRKWTPRPNREAYNTYMREYMREWNRKHRVKSLKKIDMINENTKKKIVELRDEGASWSVISNATQLSIYLVRKIYDAADS